MVGAELASETDIFVAVVPLSCTWQLTLVLLVALEGEQEIPVSVGSSAFSVMEAVLVDPFRLALTVAVAPVVIVPAVTAKLALAAPAAAVTDAGTVRFALFDDTASTEPPAGAAPLNAAVQLDTPPEFNDVGVHVNPVIVTGAFSVMEAVLVDPFKLALTVAVPPVVTVPAVTAKLALAAPAAAVTDAGTVRFALFDDTASTEPPEGAAPLNAAVQLDTPPEFNDVGVHVSPVIVTGAFSVMEAVLVDPFSEALTVAEPSVVIVPAVAEKLALVAPAAAVTDAGTVRFALFDDTASTKPPAGAAPLNVAVQFATPPECSDVGVHVNPVTVTGGASSVMAAVLVDPFNLALTVAVAPAVIVPAVTAKLALAAPAAAVTDAGAVRFALFDDTASTKPPAGAAPLNVAVQFATPPECSDVGEHVNPVTVTGGATSVMAAVLVDPFSEALTVAELSVVIVPAVAEKLTLAAPAAAVTEAGTVRAA